MRWTFFRDCVTFVNFCALNWSHDFVLFRGLHEDFGGSSSYHADPIFLSANFSRGSTILLVHEEEEIRL